MSDRAWHTSGDIDRATADKQAENSTTFSGRSLLNVTVTTLSRNFSPTNT